MKTPLYSWHKSHGAEMIAFGSWEMPVKYSSIIEEHITTRTKVALFDTCHMGEFLVKGNGSLQTLQMLVPRDVSTFKNNHCYYTHLCNESGGVIDDIIIYRFLESDYLVVGNSETIDKDYEWINQHKQNCTVENISQQTGKIDVQGPLSRDLINIFLTEKVDSLKFYSFKKYVWKNLDLLISRTGYTGELGYEIYGPADKIEMIWNTLMDLGKDFGILPAGLGARDTLRLEMGYPLMGMEMNDHVTPIEAGFEAMVNLTTKKNNFIGKEAMRNTKNRRIGFMIESGGIARHETSVFDKNQKLIGKVTSGTFSPSLKKAIGLALCDTSLKAGEKIFFEIRGKMVEGKVTEAPFVKETSLKK